MRLKRSDGYRFGFQVSPYIVFYQGKKGERFISQLSKRWKVGYIRERKDKILEWIIGDKNSLRKILKMCLPYLILKKRHPKLVLKIIDFHETAKTKKKFLRLAELIDSFQTLNYSKKGKITTKTVRRFLNKRHCLTP
jgi:hypothetical protein